MGLFELFEAKARSDSEEQAGIAKLAKDAEPLVASLLPGRNYFTPKQYSDLVVYLFEGTEGQRNKAMDSGEFSVGDIDIVRHKYADSEWITAGRLAKMVGKNRTLMHRLLSASDVTRKKRGNRILYCFAEIKAMRWVAENENVQIGA